MLKAKHNQKPEKEGTVGHRWLDDDICPSLQVKVNCHKAILGLLYTNHHIFISMQTLTTHLEKKKL